MAGRKKITENFVGDDGGSFIAGGDDSQFTPANNLGVNRPADNPQMGDLEPQALDTKTAFMNGIVNVLSGMSKEDLERLYMSVASRVTGGTDTGAPPQANAGANMASLAPMSKMESVWSDDLDDLFAKEFENPEVKTKIKTIFEAAVNAQVQIYKTKLHEQNDARAEAAAEIVEQEFNENLENRYNELVEQVDHYLTHIADEWLEENRVNIEASVKVELAESFLDDVVTLVQKYNIKLDSDKVDVVEEAVKEVEELKSKLNDVINENIELKKTYFTEEKKAVLENATKGLTQTQIVRLKQLSENINAVNITEFESKVKIIKESLTEQKPIKSKMEETLFEEVSDIDAQDESLAPEMRAYVETISRIAKK